MNTDPQDKTRPWSCIPAFAGMTSYRPLPCAWALPPESAALRNMSSASGLLWPAERSSAAALSSAALSCPQPTKSSGIASASGTLFIGLASSIGLAGNNVSARQGLRRRNSAAGILTIVTFLPFLNFSA
jgi:hypothetical protein